MKKYESGLIPMLILPKSLIRYDHSYKFVAEERLRCIFAFIQGMTSFIYYEKQMVFCQRIDFHSIHTYSRWIVFIYKSYYCW